MRDVIIAVSRALVVVFTHPDEKPPNIKKCDMWQHPNCQFYLENFSKVSMTKLRKETISQEIMLYLQRERLSVNSLRFLHNVRPSKVKVSDKQGRLV